VPCAGDVCQGPPSMPQLLGAPASANFSGVGNLEPPPEAAALPHKAKSKKKAKPKKQAKRKAKVGKQGRARRSAGRARQGDRRGK
jgi:hypothetical protein